MTLLREPLKTDKRLNFETYRSVVRSAQNQLTFSKEFALIKTGTMTFVSLAADVGSGSLDVSSFAFGYSISGDDITVTEGYVLRGHRDPVAVAEAVITAATDPTYIYVEYDTAAGTAQLLQSNTFKSSDSAAYRWTLHKFALADEVATMSLIYHLGNCELPGVGA